MATLTAPIVQQPAEDSDLTFNADEFEEEIAEMDLPISLRETQAHVYLESVPGSEEGTGADRSCASLTMRILYGFALPPSRAVTVLSEWGRRDDHIDKHGYPYPWTSDDIRRKVEWCLGQKYHGDIGDKLHSVSGDLDAALVEEYFRGKAEEDREDELREALENESEWGIPNKEWPDATRFDQFNVPSFPLEVVKELVPAMYNLCKGVAYHVQVPVDVPALMALSVLAVTASKKITVSIRPDVYDYTHLWTIAAMLPGDRKTPGINPVREPIIEYEKTLRAKMQTDVNCRKSQRKVASERLRELENKSRKAKEDELPAMYLEMAKWNAVAESPEPTLPQILVDDITPEALGILLNANEGKAACLSDESTFVEIGLGRYSGSPNFDLYIQGHQGGMGKVNRVNREPLVVPSVHLDIGMCIQIEPLMRLVNDPIARQKGFTDRFLIALPTSLLGNRKVVMEVMNQEVKQEWNQLVNELLASQTSRQLHFDTDGFQALKEFEEKYEKTYQATGELHSLASWCSKAIPGQLCRVAALLHYGSRSQSDTVPVNVLRAAMTIIEYVIEHMKVLHNLKVQDQAVLIAREIQGLITRNGMKRFSYGQFKSTVRIVRDCDDDALLEEAYELLMRHNIIRECPTEKKRGRPTRHFEVNPIFLTKS